MAQTHIHKPVIGSPFLSLLTNEYTLAVGGAICITVSILADLPLLLLLPFALLAGLMLMRVELKYLYFLLLFCIPLSAEISVTGSLSTDFPDEGLMLLLTGAIIAAACIRRDFLPRNLLRSSLLLLVVLQLVWMLVALLYSQQVLLSTKYVLAKIWYIVPFILGTAVFLRTREDYVKASLVLVGAMLIPVVVSLLRHSLHGFTFESINSTLHPFFRNHVSYSAVIVCLVPVLVIWLLRASFLQRVVIFWLLALFMVALFFAYSRGAWLCLFTGYLTWWAIRKQKLLQLLAIGTAVAIVSIFWLITDDNYMKFAPDYNKTYFRTDFTDHMVATYQLKDISTMERFYRWVAGMRMVAHKPLTGFGPNTFNLHYKGYAVAAFKTWVSANEEKSTVHNYFLLLAVEQGFPGLLLFCVLLFLMYRTFLRGYQRLEDPFFIQLSMLCAVVLSMVVTLNLLSDLVETDKVGGLFFLLLGICIQIELKLQQGKPASEGAALHQS